MISRANKNPKEFPIAGNVFASILANADPSIQNVIKPVERNLKRHGLLFQDGDDIKFIYEVCSGTIKTTKILLDGRQQVLGFFSKGDIIGLPIISEAFYSAEAVTNSKILSYPITQIEAVMSRSPRIAKAILNLVQKEMKEDTEHMTSLGRKRPTERVATFLLMNWHKEVAASQHDRTVLKLPMSRIDIADYLGMTQETVCRVLSQFKRNGLIDASNSHEVTIQNLSSLESVAETSALY